VYVAKVVTIQISIAVIYYLVLVFWFERRFYSAVTVGFFTTRPKRVVWSTGSRCRLLVRANKKAAVVVPAVVTMGLQTRPDRVVVVTMFASAATAAADADMVKPGVAVPLIFFLFGETLDDVRRNDDGTVLELAAATKAAGNLRFFVRPGGTNRRICAADSGTPPYVGNNVAIRS
jgi:hypothetical protein